MKKEKVLKIYQKIKEKVGLVSKKQWFLLIMVITFVMIFILNHFTPIVADDFNYSFGLYNKRIASILDIIKYQHHHYLTWTGRTVVHCIAQFFLMFPKIVFNICNSIIYILFTLLVYKHAVGNEKELCPSLYLIIHLLIWFFLPVFGQDILWLVGSCNYLWGITIILLFLLPIRLYINKEKCSNNIIYIVLMFLLGIIAGWTNENNAAALLSMMALFGTYRLLNRKKISLWHISGFIGNLIGFGFMILAPGNAERSKQFADNVSFLRKFLYRIIDYSNNLIEYLLPVLVLFIIVSVIANFYGKYKGKKIIISLIYLFGSFVAIYSMLLSPSFPPRAWMGVLTFAFIALSGAYCNLDFNNKMIKTLILSIVGLSTFSGLFSYYFASRDIRKIYNLWNDRISYIEKQKAKGNRNIIFTKLYPINSHTASYQLSDLNENEKTWPNPPTASYFGLESIKGKEYKGE